MKRFVLVWGMRRGFTLVEVLIAVVIIAIVIAAQLQLFSNNGMLYERMQKKIDHALVLTLILGEEGVGFEESKLFLDDLVKPFNVDDALRQRLKAQKSELIYQEVKRIEAGDVSADEASDLPKEQVQENEAKSQRSAALVIGKSIIKSSDGSSNAVLRIEIQ